MINILKVNNIQQPSVYLFEGGMAREHRTIKTTELSYKIRIASLFTSHILVHPGNLLEEDCLYEAIKNNLDLLKVGHILPVMRGQPYSMEEYAERYKSAYEKKDPLNPYFYKAKPVDKSMVDIILRRAKLFNKNAYSILSLGTPDNTGLKNQFVDKVKYILSQEPDISDDIKAAILDRAQASAPLGRIRNEVIRGRYKGNLPIQRITKRINVAFFAVGASELDSWFSLSERAFDDLCYPFGVNETTLSELVEFSVDKILGKPSHELVAEIPSEEFIAISTSKEAQVFRELIAKTIASELNQSEELAVRQARPDLREAFRDLYLDHLRRAISKRERDEERYLNIGLSLISFISNFFLSPLAGMGIDIAQRTNEGIIKRHVTPITFLQERFNKALVKQSRKSIR